MVSAIRGAGVAVFVANGSVCASACFLLLAAAPQRFAGNEALIGVHSASVDGEETVLSEAATTEMARAAADLGVPPVILGKMVATAPQHVAWLTHDDLAAMRVKLIAAAELPVAPPAELPPESAPPPALAATGLAFRGVVFCAAGPAALRLRMLPSADPDRSRAEIDVGPTATNPSVPAASFVAEGRLDLGGALDLRPVTRLSQPPGGMVVGLVGRSGDGGRTFAGRVAAGPDGQRRTRSGGARRAPGTDPPQLPPRRRRRHDGADDGPGDPPFRGDQQPAGRWRPLADAARAAAGDAVLAGRRRHRRVRHLGRAKPAATDRSFSTIRRSPIPRRCKATAPR